MNVPVIKNSFNAINNLLYQSYLPKIINSALEIGLFETVGDDYLRLSEIAKATDTNESVLEALLDVLIIIGIAKEEGGKYALSGLAKDFLLDESGANQISVIRNFTGSQGPFDNLVEVLKNGPSEFNPNIWSSKAATVEMEQSSRGGALQEVVTFVGEIPEFKNCVKMCDFAGNTGYYSLAMMNENPDLRCLVYDLPAICEIAEEMRKDEENGERITFHPMDITKGDPFGDGYDLFFSSHFLYELGANNTLTDFLKKVNKAMRPGGLFISNHISPLVNGCNYLTLAICELMTRAVGYPTHRLPEEILKTSLTEAGFGQFRVKQLINESPIPTLLLSALKVSEVG